MSVMKPILMVSPEIWAWAGIDRQAAAAVAAMAVAMAVRFMGGLR
jgi:hypothetical protein